jgi:ferredoxin
MTEEKQRHELQCGKAGFCTSGRGILRAGPDKNERRPEKSEE